MYNTVFTLKYITVKYSTVHYITVQYHIIHKIAHFTLKQVVQYVQYSTAGSTEHYSRYYTMVQQLEQYSIVGSTVCYRGITVHYSTAGSTGKYNR